MGRLDEQTLVLMRARIESGDSKAGCRSNRWVGGSGYCNAPAQKSAVFRMQRCAGCLKRGIVRVEHAACCDKGDR